MAFTAGLALGLGLALTAGAPGTAFAQAYPTKPVRLVVPFPGGSLTDTFMRVFAERMQVALGQTILVDPKPGGGTVIGTQYVLQQPNDGYNMLLIGSSQQIRSALANPPFDIRKDINFITTTHHAPLLFAINPEKLPNVKTMKDFADYARANPGKVNFSSYGTGTLGHLMLELFVAQAGINVVHVPYNGSAADLTALARGDSHIAVDAYGLMRPHIDAGRIKPIAVITLERFPLYPDIPGMRESGFPAFDYNSYQGLGVPAGAPRAVIDRLHAAAQAAIQSQQVKDHYAKVGLIPKGSTPEEFTAIVNKETAAFARVIKERNITIE